jgi:multiple sugar transport system ATP-binding protein
MNFIRAHLEREDGDYVAAFANTKIKLTRESVREHQDVGNYVGKEVVLGIRPENMEDAKLMEITAESDCITVTPQVIESMGSEKYVYFALPKDLQAHLESVEAMTGEVNRDATGDTGDSASAEDFGDLMVARISPESDVREGEKIQFAVEADKIHIFDPETEQAVL